MDQLIEILKSAGPFIYCLAIVFMFIAGLKLLERVNVDWKSLAWACVLLAIGLSRL